ncbi:MAG: exodeoxyribonuclease III [Planctomycetes bacterium]|nr:exodeoxyribonuclease III [Planctomycetota bacterium]
MKLISWNVNGIRAVISKGFHAFVAQAAPDVLCIQESRALADQVDLALPDYRAFWTPARKKGYAGTLTLTRREPRSVSRGLGRAELDDEGRVTTLEFDDCFVVNVYTPNSGQTLDRLAWRTEVWDPAFLAYVKDLERARPVIFCGDLNVAHRPIDLANPDINEHSAGYTPQERSGMDALIAAGFIDTFREFCSDGGRYTWWTYRFGARRKNIGWRIDYICISPALRPRLLAADILADVLGSDHCPITATFADR